MKHLTRVLNFLVRQSKDSGLTDEENRRRTFVSAGSLLVVPILIWFTILEIYRGTPVMVAMLCLGAVILGFTYLSARFWTYRPIFVRLTLGYFCVILFFQLLRDVGAHILFYPLIIQMLSVYLFGRKEGLIWGIALMTMSGPFTLFAEQMGSEYLVGTAPYYLGAFAMTIAFSFYYDSQRGRMLEFLDEQNKSLQEEQAKLLATQRDLEQSEDRFRTFAELGSDWLFELDKNLSFSYVSPRLREITKEHVDLIGLNVLGISGFYEAEDKDSNLLVVEKHKPFRNFRMEFAKLDGEFMTVLTSGEPIFDESGEFQGYKGTASDISLYAAAQRELREKDRVLQQAQKMEALGQLTSGVAHDFNNLLTIIGGNLELLRMRHEELESDTQIDAAQAAVLRAADLTGQLLSFARKQPLKPQAIAIGELLDNMASMMERTLGKDIELTVTHDPDLWLCHVDGGQLENSLLNLAINASHAMDEVGRLTIRASNAPVELDEGAASEFIRIEVEDSGCGMPEEMLPRITEPFFTTKEAGEGTGLGLSMVYGFVNQSGGDLAIESEVGVGTCVTILLPRAGSEKTVTDSGGSQAPKTLESLDVVLLEDDDEVRGVLEVMLKSLGHRVQATADPDEMRSLIESSPPDLLVSDVILGGGNNGASIAEQLQQSDPQIRSLLISGYPTDALNKIESKSFQPEVLAKPFSLDDLEQTIQRVMG